MRKNASAGVVSSVGVVLAVLALVIIIVGVLYLLPQRDAEDIARVSDNVADEVSRAATAVRETSEDLATTAKVKTALAISKSVQAFYIDVDSRDGIVSLSGTVPSAEVEAAALQIARDTSGVVDVVDQLVVDTDLDVDAGVLDESLMNRLADAEIKALVYERLLHADHVDAGRVDIVVVDRTVTLTGTVTSEMEKESVEAIAASVAGVEAVTNQLKVSDSFSRTSAVSPPERLGQ